MPTGMTQPAPPSPVDKSLQAFQWAPQPDADRLIKNLVSEFLQGSAPLRALGDRLSGAAGVRLTDLVDGLLLPADDRLQEQLYAAGYSQDEGKAFRHPGGIFPVVTLCDGNARELSIRVDSVADFLAANGSDAEIEGRPFSAYRRALWQCSPDFQIAVIERHGYRGFSRPPFDSDRAIAAVETSEAFRTRRRLFDDSAAGFAYAWGLIDAAIEEVGADYACDLFFAAEREYWQRRNRAAQVQKSRQDRLGIGWANHDHHTYRSSRRDFGRLISTFEKLGFHCRERFYAGRQAGWGAQVLEQANAGVVIFADVDLSADEVLVDFAHEPLPERDTLGTVGLWCALHGESFLEAGMHHLECRFDFDALRRQLEAEAGIRTMKPFTDFAYLRQAFTEGERWPVRQERIADLVAHGHVTPAQATAFREQGAIGSHLENLERNDGFKGFNQHGVSEIIAATDPRRHVEPRGRDTGVPGA